MTMVIAGQIAPCPGFAGVDFLDNDCTAVDKRGGDINKNGTLSDDVYHPCHFDQVHWQKIVDKALMNSFDQETELLELMSP